MSLDDLQRAWELLQEAYQAQMEGDYARAVELYELAVEQAPVPSRHTAAALMAMAEIYEERGDTQTALELLKQALAARTGTTA